MGLSGRRWASVGGEHVDLGVMCWRVDIKARELWCVERGAGGSGEKLEHSSGLWQAGAPRALTVGLD